MKQDAANPGLDRYQKKTCIIKTGPNVLTGEETRAQVCGRKIISYDLNYPNPASEFGCFGYKALFFQVCC